MLRVATDDSINGQIANITPEPISHSIVAPESKCEKVFQEIRRPVFSLLEKGPLAENCTYLSYGGLRELAAQKHLTHLSDTVLDEYAEEAE